MEKIKKPETMQRKKKDEKKDRETEREKEIQSIRQREILRKTEGEREERKRYRA